MERGTVHKINNKNIYIKTRHKKGVCDSCGAKSICQSSAGGERFIKAGRKAHHRSLSVGDEVVFEINPFQSTAAVLFFYGMPMVGALAGLLISSYFSLTEAKVVIIVLASVIASLGIQIWIQKKYKPFSDVQVDIRGVNDRKISAKERQLHDILMSEEGTIPVKSALSRAKQRWQK